MFEEEILTGFWTHVEELRGVFLRISFVIISAFIIALYFQDPLMHAVKATIPKSETRNDIKKETLQKERISNNGSQPRRVELPAGTGHVFLSPAAEVVQLGPRDFQLNPGSFIEFDRPVSGPQLVTLSPLEGALTAIRVSFWVGLALSSPIWVALLLQFILPGLTKVEKKWLNLFLSFSVLFVSLGIGLAYYITIPLANSYFAFFNSGVADNLWSLARYVDYTVVLIAGHMIAFELSLLLLLLVHLGVISADSLIAKRRTMIVLAFVIGGVLTPPDVLTQLILAIPLICIYEVAIVYAKIRSSARFKRHVKDAD